ncbi:19226_t:CDS:1, partial [Dentiscutata erythropus]
MLENASVLMNRIGVVIEYLYTKPCPFNNRIVSTIKRGGTFRRDFKTLT